MFQASDKILAKIIVDHESPFLKSIIINKGSKDNIKLEQIFMINLI
jgi:rod shape-determining protein MreC